MFERKTSTFDQEASRKVSSGPRLVGSYFYDGAALEGSHCRTCVCGVSVYEHRTSHNLLRQNGAYSASSGFSDMHSRKRVSMFVMIDTYTGAPGSTLTRPRRSLLCTKSEYRLEQVVKLCRGSPL